MPHIMLLWGGQQTNLHRQGVPCTAPPRVVKETSGSILAVSRLEPVKETGGVSKLLHQSSEVALMEELDSIKKILDPKTPFS